MTEITGDKFSFYMDLVDEKGNVWGTVSVVPIKERNKRDIILSDLNNGKFLFRSSTELLNMLMKRKVSYKERKDVMEFLSDSFLFLEQNDL
jgi:hypothetical protein